MKKSDFYYELPEELIAQTPLEPRDISRLLKIDRIGGDICHEHFYELANFLNAGDLLVLNDSKVFPARLYGKKQGSGIDIELLLLEQKSKDEWEVMARPGRRLKKASVIDFDEGLKAEVIAEKDGGNKLVKFYYSNNDNIFDLLERIGNIPLPPYITEKLKNKSRYNTIYASKTGSAAAPTAGLHFTERVFESLNKKGVETAYVTLHVGVGTFRPVKTNHIEEHKMHSEYYNLPTETMQKIVRCKERNGRVIAVGTTACRTLEASGGQAGSGSTEIFIYPGYKFKIIDGLLTNFHLPESTLIMLVSAFLGREKTLAAYEEAIKERYRFFSFGDAMLMV